MLTGKTRASAVKFLRILFQNIRRINNSSFEILVSSSQGYSKLLPEMLIVPVFSCQLQLIQVFMLMNQTDDFQILIHALIFMAFSFQAHMQEKSPKLS